MNVFSGFSYVFGSFSRRVQKLLRISKNDLFKVPSWCNFLKEMLSFVEIGALFVVENLLTVKIKIIIIINIIVNTIHSSHRSESKIRSNKQRKSCQIVEKENH